MGCTYPSDLEDGPKAGETGGQSQTSYLLLSWSGRPGGKLVSQSIPFKSVSCLAF